MSLTPSEQKDLIILAEECGEVVQAVAKIFRFGADEKNPAEPEGLTNREKLELEVADVASAVKALVKGRTISPKKIRHFEEEKSAKVAREKGEEITK